MIVLYIPNGPKNLAPIFPFINWDNVEEYYIQFVNNGSTVAKSTMNVIEDCEEDRVRIHFLTISGVIDGVTMKKVTIEHEAKSSRFEKPVSSIKSAHAISRSSVRSNDIFTCSIQVNEEDIEYYDELFDSPKAWIEWKGTQGQPDDYLPIVISDKKTEKLKEEDRFDYTLYLEFIYSKEKLSIRG